MGAQCWDQAPDEEGDDSSPPLWDSFQSSCVLKNYPMILPFEKVSLFLSSADEEAKLDELVVVATEKRRTFPRQILPHVVHGLKAERKLMVGCQASTSLPGLCSSYSSVLKLLLFVLFPQELFQENVPPLQLPSDPSQGCHFGFR